MGAAAALGAAALITLTGCVSTVPGTAVRAQHAGPVDLPPLTESELDAVMLSIGELNGIVGASRMEVTSELEEMTDHSEDVSDPDCLAVIYGAEEPVYAGTGWTAMRDQVAREPDDDNDHWVEQTAVLYPSAARARDFFVESSTVWKNCANSAISVGDGLDTYTWQVADVELGDDLVTQMSTQQHADGWACQHALSVVSNLTAEAWACGYSVTDEAAQIVEKMRANAAK